MEAHPCGTAADTLRLAEDHVRALQKIPFLKRAAFLWAPERNMAHQGEHLYHNLRKYPRFYPLCVKAPDIVGTWTDQFSKAEYALAAREHVVRNQVKIFSGMICANSKMQDESGGLIPANDRPAAILEKFVDQMNRFSTTERETTDPLTTKRTGVSGVMDKFGKVDPSLKDDVAMSFILAMGTIDKLRQGRYPFVNRKWLPEGCVLRR